MHSQLREFAQGPAEANRQSVTADKAARLHHSAKRTTLVIAAAYLYDALILFGFSAAGYVNVLTPVVVSALLIVLVGAIWSAHASGWSLARRDPTLFLPHQICVTAITLGAALFAPQIAFQPFATLFAISAFSFMAPSARSLVISWVVVAIGVAAVVFAVGPELAIPAKTAAGQALTSAVVAGLLARCIWIAMFVRKLRAHLAEKNETLRKATQRIEALARTDDLTGLANRRAIIEFLRQHMAISRRASLPLSLGYVDVDHFKKINDAYGHLAGDHALKAIGEALAGAVRDTDRIGRSGGEEFLVVMTATSLQNTVALLEGLRKRVAAIDWAAIGLPIEATITIGAAQYASGETVEALVRRADLALYIGKEGGRNRIVFNPPLEAITPPRALSA